MQATAMVAPVQSELESLEKLLISVAAVDHPPMASLLRHVLEGKGKRIRPALVFLIAQLCGCPSERFISVAAAVELLHTATLIHDDMIDDAATRRGTATLNVLAGNRISILVGDYLFAQAAGFAAQAGNLRVMEAFARVLMDMCDGEIRQLFGNGCRLISRQEYYRRIEQKTATLFRATTEMAGVISGIGEHQIRCLKAYGYHLGMAFQIVDDILDFTGGEKELGKPVGNDLRQGTITLPVICAAEMFPNDVALRGLALGDPDDQDLNAIIELVRNSDCIGRVRQEAEEHTGLAIEALADFSPGPARSALERIATSSINRTF